MAWVATVVTRNTTLSTFTRTELSLEWIFCTGSDFIFMLAGLLLVKSKSCAGAFISFKFLSAVSAYMAELHHLAEHCNYRATMDKATPNKFPVSRPPPASFSGMSQNFPLILVLLHICSTRIYFRTRSIVASSE